LFAVSPPPIGQQNPLNGMSQCAGHMPFPYGSMALNSKRPSRAAKDELVSTQQLV
jgi:hypothetical protein